jgi:hypothetical protein
MQSVLNRFSVVARVDLFRVPVRSGIWHKRRSLSGGASSTVETALNA